MLGNHLAADDFSRRHFQMHFFLGALRVKAKNMQAESEVKIWHAENDKNWHLPYN